MGDVLRHIIQPRRAHGVLDTPFTLRIVGGQQTDRRQLDYTELGMWRNFTHCGVLYAMCRRSIRSRRRLRHGEASNGG